MDFPAQETVAAAYQELGYAELAVLVYQLAVWHRFEVGDDLRVGLKPFLKAA